AGGGWGGATAGGRGPGSASFAPVVGPLHDIRPLARLGGEEGAEFLGRGDVRLDAELGQVLPCLGGAQAGNDRAVELVDDARRRAGGWQAPRPERQYVVGVTPLQHGGGIPRSGAGGAARGGHPPPPTAR